MLSRQLKISGYDYVKKDCCLLTQLVWVRVRWWGWGWGGGVVADIDEEMSLDLTQLLSRDKRRVVVNSSTTVDFVRGIHNATNASL